MTSLTAGSGLMVLPESYVHSLENRCRSGDEQLLDSEVARLCLEEQKKQLEQQVANAQCDVELHQWAIQNYEAQTEMKWRRRFCILAAVVVVACWLLALLIVVPHWQEIAGWYCQ